MMPVFLFLKRLKIPIQQRIVLFDHPACYSFFEKGEGALAELDVGATLPGKTDGEADVLSGIVDTRLGEPLKMLFGKRWRLCF